MTTTNILLQLVAKAVNEDYRLNLEDFSQDKVNWMEVLDIAIAQGVYGLVFEVIEHLPEGCRPDLGTLMEWYGQVHMMESEYEQYRETIFSLADFYAENGFRMMLLKGVGVSECWPKPNRRPIGDIDIYLLEAGGAGFSFQVLGGEPVWKRADKVVTEKLGIEVDNTHHHHSVFIYRGVSVENHFDFINAYDHRSSRPFEAKLKELAAEGCMEHGSCKSLYLANDDFNALFLLKHCSGHFASTEITLRQMLDWLLFVRGHHDGIDWDRLYKSLDEFGLRRLARIFGTIAVKYLGFSHGLFRELEQDNELVDRVLCDILSPEFDEHEDGTLLSGLWIKPRRFWHNRWKHRLCYSDSFVSGFLWTTYAKLLKPRHFKV